MAFPQSFFSVTTPAQRSLPLPSSISLFRTGPGLSSALHPPKVGLKLPCLCYRHPTTVQVFPPPHPAGPRLSFLAYTLTVQFSNGKLRNPGDMHFTLYNSTDLVNPRQRSHRIVVSACWCRWSGLCRPQKGSWCGQTWETWPEGRKGGVANETRAPPRGKILGELVTFHLYGLYLSRQGFFR